MWGDLSRQRGRSPQMTKWRSGIYIRIDPHPFYVDELPSVS